MLRTPLVLMALLSLLTGLTAHAQSVFVGPKTYLSTADIPDGFYGSGVPAALDDFLDCSLDHGITEPTGTAINMTGTGGCQGSGNVDSVDADDGVIDGVGLAGHSWFGDNSMTFTFASPVSAAGLVWTGGSPAGDVYFAALLPEAYRWVRSVRIFSATARSAEGGRPRTASSA